MAQLDEWQPDSFLPPAAVDAVREDLRGFFWRWYEEHRDDVLVRRRVLFWTLVIRVRDLEFLFEMLFGSKTQPIGR